MKILVCIKQVIDSIDTMEIDARTGWFSYRPSSVFRMNRFDEFALEEALQLRERTPGTLVHALSVGPHRVTSTIRRALETGADHGIHILVEQDEFMSPCTVAEAIAAHARGTDYDLVITGAMAEDDMAGVTGQLVAAILDLPCVSSVVRTEYRAERSEMVVDREIENGHRESYLLGLPAVVTIQSGINTPRYPSLSNVLRARSRVVETMGIEDLHLRAPREVCAGTGRPDTSSLGVFLEGTARDKARELVGILHERSLFS